MLTRFRFGDYSPDLWLVQYILQGLGYDPGPLDGLWGPSTEAAANTFASVESLTPVHSLAEAVNQASSFGVALRNAAESGGLDLSVVPPSEAPAGTGGGGATVATGAQPSAAASPRPQISPPPGSTVPRDPTIVLLGLAVLGVGLYLAFGRRKRGA